MTIPIADDSFLFLWTPSSNLPSALRVMDAWGFCYKTSIVWVKTKKDQTPIMAGGMGWWVTMQHELVLVGVRGRPQRPYNHPLMHSLILAPSPRNGGGKPEELQDRIERELLGPYLELFARRQRPGWTCWGDELIPDEGG